MITSLTVNFIVYATMDEREGFTAFVVPHVIIQRAAWMLIKANEQQQTTRKESEFLNCAAWTKDFTNSTAQPCVDTQRTTVSSK